MHGYLYGEAPPAFDVLYWNTDVTRMPRAMHSYYLREFYLHNKLVQKAGLTLAGHPIDIGRIRQPLYAVGCEEDHIAPWKATFKIAGHIGAPVHYTLSSSGHILGIINPPITPPKRSYWSGLAGSKSAGRMAPRACREQRQLVPGPRRAGRARGWQRAPRCAGPSPPPPRRGRGLPADQATALATAAARIRAYHERQKLGSWTCREADGSEFGQQVTPLDRVGVYVPGGRAAYPSSVLMNVIPARVAGVPEVTMVVPTPDGVRNPLVLAAAHLAGASRAFAIGGAQAIAALAHGTATIAAVDKICGPGNAYVAAAKRRVFGAVGIDLVAGASEVLVIADALANPDWVAMDLFAQAEHDEMLTSPPSFASSMRLVVWLSMYLRISPLICWERDSRQKRSWNPAARSCRVSGRWLTPELATRREEISTAPAASSR